MAEHVTQVMPQASLTILPGEGHLLLFTHWPGILRRLAAQQTATRNTNNPAPIDPW